MTFIVRIWQRLPVVIRAIATGLVVLLAGNLPWGILIGTNLKLTPSIPWAVFATIVYLWFYWQYLNGKGKPSKTSVARFRNFRANPLSSRVWLWSLLSGILGIGGVYLFSKVYVRALGIHLGSPLPDLSQYPDFTVIASLLMASVVTGIVEEGAFRGYMQKPIEERHGPVAAVLIVGLVFGLSHFTHASMSLLLIPIFVAWSAVYGALAYITNSVIPGMLLHAVGNAIELVVLWTRGMPQAEIPTTGGMNNQFLLSAIAFILLLGAMSAFMKLKTVVKQFASST